jgi:hypothetical protein
LFDGGIDKKHFSGSIKIVITVASSSLDLLSIDWKEQMFQKQIRDISSFLQFLPTRTVVLKR